MLLLPVRRLQIGRRRGGLGDSGLNARLDFRAPAPLSQASARADNELDKSIPAPVIVDNLDTGLVAARVRPEPARLRDPRLQTDRAQSVEGKLDDRELQRRGTSQAQKALQRLKCRGRGARADLPRHAVRDLAAQNAMRVHVDRHALLALPVGHASTTRAHRGERHLDSCSPELRGSVTKRTPWLRGF